MVSLASQWFAQHCNQAHTERSGGGISPWSRVKGCDWVVHAHADVVEHACDGAAQDEDEQDESMKSHASLMGARRNSTARLWGCWSTPGRCLGLHGLW